MDREWPYVLQAGSKDRTANPAAAARADRLVTNHAVTRTVTHGPVSATRRHSRKVDCCTDVLREYLFFPAFFHFFPQIQAHRAEDVTVLQEYFFTSGFFTYSHKRKARFPQAPFFFPRITFQSLGCVMKRAAAFRVCPHSVMPPQCNAPTVFRVCPHSVLGLGFLSEQ